MDVTIGTCELEILRPRGSVMPWEDDADHKALAEKVQGLVLTMLDEMLPQRLAKVATSNLPEIAINLDLKAQDLDGAAPLARAALHTQIADAITQALPPTKAGVGGNPGKIQETEGRACQVAEGGAGVPQRLTQRRKMAGRALDILLKSKHGVAALSTISTPTLAACLHWLAVEESTYFSLIDVRRNLAARPADGASVSTAETQRRQAVIALLLAFAQALQTLRAAPAVAQPLADSGLQKIAQDARVLLRQIMRTSDATATQPTAAQKTTGKEYGTPKGTTGRRARRDAQQSQSDLTTNVAARTLAPGDYELDHLLPFLAFAALSQRGILDALALDIDGASPFAATLGAAIAQKCLYTSIATRPPSVKMAIAYAAGLMQAPDGQDYAKAAANLPEAELARSVMAATLVDTLAERPTLPLIVQDDRLVLVDPGGFFPVAAGTVSDLLPMLLRLNRCYFVNGSHPAIWNQLAMAKLRLVGDGAPVAGENAAPVIGKGGWQGRATRNAVTSTGFVGTLTQESETAARAAELWHGLRAGAPLALLDPMRDSLCRMEEVASLLAGYALADIGWRLAQHAPAAWANPDGDLVCRRFSDLGAKLRVTPDRLELRMPLGRRFNDLGAIGLLDPVQAPPWWPGAQLRIGGG